MSDRTPTSGKDDRPTHGGDRDKGGPSGPRWRVTPAPDGRGADQGEGGARPPGRPWLPLAAVFLVMLGINFALSEQALGPAERVRIPYQPTFLEQIRADNVRSISSEEQKVQGELKRAIRYPPDDQDAPRSTRFDTHVPAFADTGELAALLKQHNVTVDARAPDTGAPLWETLLLGLGPTILLFALLLYLFRRAAQRAGGLGGMGGLGRAKVKRADPAEVQVTFDDVAGI